MSIAVNYADFRNLFMAGEPLALDGFPTWDATRFNGTSIIWTNWQITFPVTIAAAAIDDAVPYADEWHWYLSQPTETTTPRMALSRFDNLPTGTRSGRVRLSLTAAGSALLAGTTLGPPHSAEAMANFLRGTYVYSCDIANEQYLVADLYRLAFSPAQLSF